MRLVKKEFGSPVQEFVLRRSSTAKLDCPKSFSELTNEELERDITDLIEEKLTE